MNYLIALWLASVIVAWALTYAYAWHKFNRNAHKAYIEGRAAGFAATSVREWEAGFFEGVKSSGVRKRTPKGKFATDAAWRAEKQ
jgi:hypothetical protein